jgi:hypothetical protein
LPGNTKLSNASFLREKGVLGDQATVDLYAIFVSWHAILIVEGAVMTVEPMTQAPSYKIIPPGQIRRKPHLISLYAGYSGAQS